MSDSGAQSARGTGTLQNSQILEGRETFSTLKELSELLNTGLDSESLRVCVRLCEQGAHPEALATIIRELRRESQAIKAAAASTKDPPNQKQPNNEAVEQLMTTT